MKRRNETKPFIEKGALLPVINVTTQRRAGNKHVTLIHNLEKFGIDLKDFAKYVQNAAASSASVTTDSSGSKSEMVLIQGNQTKFVKKLFLEKLNFPAKHVLLPSK